MHMFLTLPPLTIAGIGVPVGLLIAGYVVYVIDKKIKRNKKKIVKEDHAPVKVHEADITESFYH